MVTFSGVITPWLLLILTPALSLGDAIEAPTWRAIFPELVKKEDLTPAFALNGIEFNLARAVGPGLGGVIVAVAGAATAFFARCSVILRSDLRYLPMATTGSRKQVAA